MYITNERAFCYLINPKITHPNISENIRNLTKKASFRIYSDVLDVFRINYRDQLEAPKIASVNAIKIVIFLKISFLSIEPEMRPKMKS